MSWRSVLLLVALSGCDPDPDPNRPFTLESISIGGGKEDGSAGWVELTDEGPISLVPGLQGGFHFYLNVKVRVNTGAPPNSLVFERTARREDTGDLLSRGKQRLELAAGSDGDFYTNRSQQMILCPTPAGIQAADALLRVRVEASEPDSTEILAQDEILVKPKCPEDALAEYCADICGG